MKSTWILVILAVVLAGAGVWLSDKLLAKHVKAPGVPDWLNEMCESGDSGNVSCDTVLSSKWGMWPIAQEGDPDDLPRTPVALIGMEYFTALLAWFLIVGRPNRHGRFWHLVPLLVNAAGLAGSIGFIKVMATDLTVWCPLCLATHVVNALLFVVNVLLWPRRKRVPAGTEARAEAAAPVARHPSIRLAVVALFVCLMLPQLELQMVSVTALKRANEQLTTAMDEVQGDVNALIAMHLAVEKKKIDIRPDDPIRHNEPGLPIVVVFSDFECSSCKKFASDFEEKCFPAFADKIRIVYKHYPLCLDCNEHVQRCTHKNACRIAELAEAVRMVGGPEKFWEAHDLFFENQKTLGSLTTEMVADRLGLSASKLVDALGSDTVKRRIAEDIAQAQSLGVKSTPTVFFNGREVSGWTRGVEKFWQQLGAMYTLQRLRESAAQQQRGNKSPGA